MELELNLLEYWKIIRQRWKVIVLVVILVVSVAGFVSFFVMKPEYEASATLLVQSQQAAGEQVMYNDILANQKLVKTYTEVIKSRYVADDVIERLSLTMSPEALLGKVKVITAADSLVTKITVADSDPERAVQIANGFAVSFSHNLSKIMKVDNVSILDKAQSTKNPAPARPNPKMNIIIAAVVGTIIGVMIALVMEFLDKTIKSEDEIEELLGVPVLGVIATISEGEQRGKRKTRAVDGGVTRES